MINNIECSYENAQSTRNYDMFGSSSSLCPLVGGGGGLVCESVGIADLLSDDFDSKQSRKSVHLTLIYHPFPTLITLAFMSSEVRHLLLDLEPYGGTDSLCMFPLFLKRTAGAVALVSLLCFNCFFV